MDDYKPSTINHETRTRLRASVRKAKSPEEALEAAREICAVHPQVLHVSLEPDGVHVCTCDTTFIYATARYSHA